MNAHPSSHLRPLLPETGLTHVVLKGLDQQVVSAVGAKLRANEHGTMGT